MANPKHLYPKPPFKQQPQEWPGLDSLLDPQPDFGQSNYQGHNKLQNKVALITGGDSGIGKAIAYTFAAEGAGIAISYLPQEESDAQDVVAEVEKLGRKIITFPGDIQSELHCQTMVEETVRQLGKLDILVNNAAYQMSVEKITDITEDLMDQTFKTNFHAMVYLTKAAWAHLPEGGSILNTTSIQAFKPSPEIMVYAASKAAIANFTQSLAKEAIDKGIRVNAVAPGPIWTPLNPATRPAEEIVQFGAHSVMGRPGQPIEVAKVFVFLASDDASYVTGHIYGVTGGGDMPV